MPRRLRRRRYGNTKPLSKRQRAIIYFFFVGIVLVAMSISAGHHLKELTLQFAVSETNDIVFGIINDTINSNMREGAFDYGSVINLEKDNNGNITAITTNMSHVNELSSKIIREIIDSSDTMLHTVNIPVGTLTNSSLLLGRGPRLPVMAEILTSSSANFRNEFVSGGINQTKHQIVLELQVDIDILIPYDTFHNTVKMEMIVAETIIVGQVPDTYLKLDGRTA